MLSSGFTENDVEQVLRQEFSANVIAWNVYNDPNYPELRKKLSAEPVDIINDILKNLKISSEDSSNISLIKNQLEKYRMGRVTSIELRDLLRERASQTNEQLITTRLQGKKEFIEKCTEFWQQKTTDLAGEDSNIRRMLNPLMGIYQNNANQVFRNGSLNDKTFSKARDQILKNLKILIEIAEKIIKDIAVKDRQDLIDVFKSPTGIIDPNQIRDNLEKLVENGKLKEVPKAVRKNLTKLKPINIIGTAAVSTGPSLAAASSAAASSSSPDIRSAAAAAASSSSSDIKASSSAGTGSTALTRKALLRRSYSGKVGIALHKEVSPRNVINTESTRNSMDSAASAASSPASTPPTSPRVDASASGASPKLKTRALTLSRASAAGVSGERKIRAPLSPRDATPPRRSSTASESAAAAATPARRSSIDRPSSPRRRSSTEATPPESPRRSGPRNK